MGKPVHTPRESKWNISTIDIIILVFVIGVIFLIVGGFVTHYNKDKNYMENFYQREKSTLVKVNYGKDFLTYSRTVGYINNEDLQNFKNGEEIKTNITIYNPYYKEKSIIIPTKNIINITTITHKECYNEYRPK